MLDQHRIAVGKLKQAYKLNARDVERLFAALWPDGVFPYELWEQAYASFWRDAATHNAIYHCARAVPSLPEIDPSKYEKTPLYPYQNKIVPFFVELSRKLFSADLRAGFYYITETAYDEDAKEFKEKVEYIFNRLAEVEEEFDLRKPPPFLWATNVTAERFKEMVDLKILSVPTPCYAFLEKMFTDTILVDKSAAVLYFHSSGYSLRREVKGLSRALVKRIITEASSPQLSEKPSPDSPQAATLPAIFVSRSLWDGKTEQAVRDAMKEQNFRPSVIAHVLHHWCGFENKTQIGRWLGKPGLTDRAYLRLADKLLAEAVALNIQSV
jgi:hypothetical protein